MVDEWKNQSDPSMFRVGDEVVQALEPVLADIHYGAMGCGIPGLEIGAAPGFAIEERRNSQSIEADAFGRVDDGCAHCVGGECGLVIIGAGDFEPRPVVVEVTVASAYQVH